MQENKHGGCEVLCVTSAQEYMYIIALHILQQTGPQFFCNQN